MKIPWVRFVLGERAFSGFPLPRDLEIGNVRAIDLVERGVFRSPWIAAVCGPLLGAQGDAQEQHGENFRGRAKRQRDESQGTVGASGGGQGGGSYNEEVFVIMGAAVAVTDAGGGIGAHAAAAGRVVEIVAVGGGENLPVVRFRESSEDGGNVFPRCIVPGDGGVVEFVLDPGHGVAETITRGVIERQRAVAGRMHIVVSAY